MIGPSSTYELPGIISQYNDRLGRIYGPDTLEANWYEERLQRNAGVLEPKGGHTVLRKHEPELTAHQKEISGMLAMCPRTKRHPFMFQSRSVVSDGLNEKLSMNETFYKLLAERPANPVGAGTTTPHDDMLIKFAQVDEPKTRQSKDRMSNVQHEIRPVADSELKIRKLTITPETLRHMRVDRQSAFSSARGFGAVVPKHPDGHGARSFTTTTGEALSMGRSPAVLEGHIVAPVTTSQRGTFSTGGYEKTITNHTVFSFGHAKEANSTLPGFGARDHFGKTSILKQFDMANNPPVTKSKSAAVPAGV